jgi:hypothetical protein
MKLVFFDDKEPWPIDKISLRLVKNELYNLIIFVSARKPNIAKIPIYWDDLIFGKIYDMLQICSKFNKFPANDFLPICENT